MRTVRLAITAFPFVPMTGAGRSAMAGGAGEGAKSLILRWFVVRFATRVGAARGSDPGKVSEKLKKYTQRARSVA